MFTSLIQQTVISGIQEIFKASNAWLNIPKKWKVQVIYIPKAAKRQETLHKSFRQMTEALRSHAHCGNGSHA